MTATLLRQELEREGVSIQLRGENLLLSPKGQTPPSLFPHIQSLKPDLIEMLRIEEEQNEALARCPLAARAYFSIAEQAAIGRNLLRLDAGLDIETEEAHL